MTDSSVVTPVVGIDFTVEGEVFNAKKKQTMEVVTSPVDMPANSVYQKTDDETNDVITSLDGNAQEAAAKANKGDWIACGADQEKYVIKSGSFGGLYDIIAVPTQTKSFIQITAINVMDWKNAWDEAKSIPAGKQYYLMANNNEDLYNWNWKDINPMNVPSFEKTY